MSLESSISVQTARRFPMVHCARLSSATSPSCMHSYPVNACYWLLTLELYSLDLWLLKWFLLPLYISVWNFACWACGRFEMRAAPKGLTFCAFFTGNSQLLTVHACFLKHCQVQQGGWSAPCAAAATAWSGVMVSGCNSQSMYRSAFWQFEDSI